MNDLAAAMHKEWLTETEAAFYCGVSRSQFRTQRDKVGLRRKLFMGKLLYSRRHLKRLIEDTDWQPSTGATGGPISTGGKVGAGTASPSVPSVSMTPRLRAKLKHLNSGPGNGS